MKIKIITIAIFACIAAAGFTSCSNPSEEIKETKETVLEAQQDLSQALADSINEYAKLKKNQRPGS